MNMNRSAVESAATSVFNVFFGSCVPHSLNDDGAPPTNCYAIGSAQLRQTSASGH